MSENKKRKPMGPYLLCALLVALICIGVLGSAALRNNNAGKQEMPVNASGETRYPDGGEQTPEPEENDNLQVHFIDVGQADSILIRIGETAMLVDAGTNDAGPSVVRYLEEQGIDRLAYLIGTHPHEDHIGGLDDIIRNFSIDTVIMPDVSHTTRTYENVLDALLDKNMTVQKPVPGSVYPLGDASFVILSPDSEISAAAWEEGNLNNLSVGLKVTYGSTSFVMCGDAEAISEKAMTAGNVELDADVLKLGHHGSSTSSCDEFLRAVDPEYAVISCGQNNSYGHPHRETMEKLQSMGISFFRTDEQGTVIASSDGRTVRFDCEPSSLYTCGLDTHFPLPENAQGEAVDVRTYVLNTNTMKFHTPDCPAAIQMKKNNRQDFTGTREDVIQMGYGPCSQCSP